MAGVNTAITRSSCRPSHQLFKEEEEHRFLDRSSNISTPRFIPKYSYTGCYRELLEWNFLEVASAYDHAVVADQEYRQKLKTFYTTRIAQQQPTDLAVVFVGRPYTLLSPALNSH